MKRLKIKFTGFPAYHNPRTQWYMEFLASRYELCECEDPDYVIDGGQDFEHIRYGGVKILMSSENDCPDFNFFDYAVGCHRLTFGDRYLRVPWYVFSPCYEELLRPREVPRPSLFNRKFCSFVVSNAEFGDPMRRQFFEALSEYRHVDSGGRYRNNVGGPVKDKLSFCRAHKFSLAFENSRCPGYVTEKIVEAYAARTIPVYFGSPDVGEDFHPDGFVRVDGVDDIARAVDEIRQLDNDRETYLKKLAAPVFAQGVAPYRAMLETFLASIFDRSLEEARRLTPYGHQAMMRRHLSYVYDLDRRVRESRLYGWAVGAAGWIRSKGRR